MDYSKKPKALEAARRSSGRLQLRLADPEAAQRAVMPAKKIPRSGCDMAIGLYRPFSLCRRHAMGAKNMPRLTAGFLSARPRIDRRAGPAA